MRAWVQIEKMFVGQMEVFLHVEGLLISATIGNFGIWAKQDSPYRPDGGWVWFPCSDVADVGYVEDGVVKQAKYRTTVKIAGK